MALGHLRVRERNVPRLATDDVAASRREIEDLSLVRPPDHTQVHPRVPWDETGFHPGRVQIAVDLRSFDGRLGVAHGSSESTWPVQSRSSLGAGQAFTETANSYRPSSSTRFVSSRVRSSPRSWLVTRTRRARFPSENRTGHSEFARR